MQCENHREREAAAICVACGKPLCNECDTMVQGKHYCRECGEKQQIERNMDYKEEDREINGFLWFIFSLVPGAGHMYMGCMKRGVMLLGAFLGLIALNNLFFIWDILALGSVLVYIYAFFDSLSIKKAIGRGMVIEDRGIDQLSLKNINLYYVGIIIIVLGALSLIQNNLYMFDFAPVLREIFQGVQRSIIPVLLIIAGVWLMKRSKREK